MSADGEAALATGDSRVAMVVYRLIRSLTRRILRPYLRVRVRGSLTLDGPVIVAPVHRSHLDSLLLSTVTTRRLRALGKASLFEIPVIGWIVAALGAVPVERGTADREAIRLSQLILDRGEAYLVFPEGTRRTGPEVAEVFDGVAFLASRTGAPIVPIGIAGTDTAMPPDARFPRRDHVSIVVGEPIAAPTSETGRVPRSELRRVTGELQEQLRSVMDEAHAERDRRSTAAPAYGKIPR
ncbi:MAG: lysophospholipid acyltransferase family protein [Actinomycetota bacterium]